MVFLGIDLGRFFSVPFWLDVNPGELSPLFEKYFLFVLFTSYVLYFVSKYVQKRLTARRSFIKATFWHKVGVFCITMAVSFTFIFFFRYEAIPILGGRFWILIWLLSGAVWLFFLLRNYFLVIPKELGQLEQKQKYNKYLVKTKKKK